MYAKNVPKKERVSRMPRFSEKKGKSCATCVSHTTCKDYAECKNDEMITFSVITSWSEMFFYLYRY